MNNSTTDFHPDKSNALLHVGIIPDGGRRWAKANNVSLSESYSKTRDLLAVFSKYFFSSGVNELSIYLSSAQNFRRGQAEVDSFTEVTGNALNNEILNLVRELNIRVNIVGNIKSLPDGIASSLMAINEKTGKTSIGTINLCIAYNPVEELIDAFRLSDGGDDFLNYLWVKKPLDLIIRSGGANLTSNFLPMQSGFARLYFIDELFNDVKLSSIKEIMNSFVQLDRKFGD